MVFGLFVSIASIIMNVFLLAVKILMEWEIEVKLPQNECVV